MFDGSLSDVVPLGLDLACGLMTVLKDDANVTVSVTVLPMPTRSHCPQSSFFCRDDEEPRNPTAEAARHFIMDITAGSEYRDTLSSRSATTLQCPAYALWFRAFCPTPSLTSVLVPDGVVLQNSSFIDAPARYCGMSGGCNVASDSPEPKHVRSAARSPMRQ